MRIWTASIAWCLALAGCSDDTGTAGAGGGAPAAHVADGTVEPWVILEPMPEARANHCSAFVGGWLVAVGGNTRPAGSPDFVSSALVHAARVEADGTLGPWQVAGTMPSTVVECTAAANGDELLVLDGIYGDISDEEQVWSATISTDGQLTAFESRGAVPQRFLSTDAAVVGETLYVMATAVPGSGDAVRAYTASVGDGPFSFQSHDVLPGFRGKAQHAIGETALFVMGGYLTGASEVVADVDGATIAGAEIGATVAGAPLPLPTSSGDAIAVDGWVFVVGGRREVFAGSAVTDVVAAPMDGAALGPWSTVSPLPEGRSNHEVTLAGDWIYVTGGGFDGPGLDTVYAARVRFGK